MSRNLNYTGRHAGTKTRENAPKAERDFGPVKTDKKIQKRLGPTKADKKEQSFRYFHRPDGWIIDTYTGIGVSVG
jgi:hypothetical protein